MNHKHCSVCGRRLRRRDYRERNIMGMIEHVTVLEAYHTVYTRPVCRRWLCQYIAGIYNEENYPAFADEVLVGGE